MTTPSAAAQVIVSIIPMVGIVFGCAVIFFYLYWNHRQRMLMIEKGVIKKAFDLDTFSLLGGLICSSIGLCLLIFFAIKEGFTYGMLGGLIPLAVGISLISFFIIRLYMKKRGHE